MPEPGVSSRRPIAEGGAVGYRRRDCPRLGRGGLRDSLRDRHASGDLGRARPLARGPVHVTGGYRRRFGPSLRLAWCTAVRWLQFVTSRGMLWRRVVAGGAVIVALSAFG